MIANRIIRNRAYEIKSTCFKCPGCLNTTEPLKSLHRERSLGVCESPVNLLSLLFHIPKLCAVFQIHRHVGFYLLLEITVYLAGTKLMLRVKP